MIRFHVEPGSDLLEVSVEGRVSDEDVKSVRRFCESLLEKHGTIRLIEEVISIDGIEPKAFFEDVSFSLRHVKDIRRCAVLADATWIKVWTAVVKPFVPGDVRFFPRTERALALEWLRDEPEPAHADDAGIHLREEPGAHLIEVVVDGPVSRDAYRRIIARIEARIRTERPFRAYLEVGGEGHLSPGAVWEDLLFGLRHRKDFSRCAVVADRKWIEVLVALWKPLGPAEVRTFHLADRETARAWVREAETGSAAGA